WRVAPGGSERAERAPVAGGSWADLRSGEKMLPTAQVGSGDARDASWNRRRSQSRPTGMRPLWSVEHRLYRAGSTDRPTWKSRAGSPYLGHSAAVSTPGSSPGMVASL